MSVEYHTRMSVCECACVRACVCVCVRACVRECLMVDVCEAGIRYGDG